MSFYSYIARQVMFEFTEDAEHFPAKNMYNIYFEHTYSLAGWGKSTHLFLHRRNHHQDRMT